MTADMSVAPEIARLAKAVLLDPARRAVTPGDSGRPGAAGRPETSYREESSGSRDSPGTAGAVATSLTLGTLARQLRAIAAAPERWWALVRFEPDRSVRITVEECASYQAWLVILPPGDAGQRCDCDVATMIAGEATEGAPASAVLRPGALRVHGQRHALRGHGPGYSISLHARAHRSAIRR